MQSNFQEKRITARSRVFFGGEVQIGSDRPAVECHVKNVSRGGASIVVQGDEFLPHEFELFIRKTSQRHNAVVTWSRGRQFGIAYRSRSSARTWSSPPALRQMLQSARSAH
jgi:hypothetical protein